MGNRKAAIDYISGQYDAIEPGGPNTKMVRDWLEGLTNAQFEEVVTKIEQGEDWIPFIKPNQSGRPLDLDRALKVAEKMGIVFEERLWMIDGATGLKYLSPIKYMIVAMPVRRQQELVSKKRSTAKHSKRTDAWTGQPVGVSASSKVTLPELMFMDEKGHDAVLDELIKIRGGDPIAFREARRQMAETGEVSITAIKALGTQPTSTQTTESLLAGMMIESNFTSA